MRNCRFFFNYCCLHESSLWKSLSDLLWAGKAHFPVLHQPSAASFWAHWNHILLIWVPGSLPWALHWQALEAGYSWSWKNWWKVPELPLNFSLLLQVCWARSLSACIVLPPLLVFLPWRWPRACTWVRNGKGDTPQAERACFGSESVVPPQ